MKGPQGERARRFFTLRSTPFIRLTAITAAAMSLVASCRIINASVREHAAWGRYTRLEDELGLRKGMERAALLSTLDAHDLSYELQGDPSRPPDKQPPQVLWSTVAKWSGPVFPEELYLEVDLDAGGHVLAWRPLQQGGP